MSAITWLVPSKEWNSLRVRISMYSKKNLSFLNNSIPLSSKPLLPKNNTPQFLDITVHPLHWKYGEEEEAPKYTHRWICTNLHPVSPWRIRHEHRTSVQKTTKITPNAHNYKVNKEEARQLRALHSGIRHPVSILDSITRNDRKCVALPDLVFNNRLGHLHSISHPIQTLSNK